ncbi:MAG: FapA family protein [Treponema sp.]|nr:FapA family protein [Treponema sp.]
MALVSQDRHTVITSGPNDGNVAVGFTEKDMEAWADFLPAARNGAPLTIRFVNMVLDKLNIVHGLRSDAIREAMRDCNNTRRPVCDVLIAKGEEPSDEIGAFYSINPKVYSHPTIPKGNGRVDYRTYTPFVIVKKDQVLARLRPRREGKTGMNIHGEGLPFQTVQPAGVRGGENTRTEDDLIRAEINGQMLEKGGVLDVKDTLTIKGPVGYATGNIIFPGNVFITGPVSDGFKIYAGGSVTIKQTFDVTDAVVKGDLQVSGGIIGRGRGLLKIGGSLKTKFIENCRAAVRKTCVVDSAIVNSQVWTLENIEMGDRGFILGAEIYALKGVKAGHIGKKKGMTATIRCGVDFTIEQAKAKTNSLIKSLAIRVRRLRGYIDAEEDAEKRDTMLENLELLLAEQQQATEQLSELLAKTVLNEGATVEVSGEIQSGTFIEICQIGFPVSEILHRVRVKLERGMVITEAL